MNEKLDDVCQRVLRTANRAAILSRQEYLAYEHIAVALLRESRDVRKWLKAQGLKPKEMYRELVEALEANPLEVHVVGRLELQRSAKAVFQIANEIASEFATETVEEEDLGEISPLHLLYALLAEDFANETFQALLAERQAELSQSLREKLKESPLPPSRGQRPLRDKEVQGAMSRIEPLLRSTADEMGFHPADFQAFAESLGEDGSTYQRELLGMMQRFISQDAPL